ncbi:MAG TPA: response regulator transcription factor [Flavisolibacter sp.]|jgi:DNA-binding NarL/FixJ family response regulator|nr:response regulator transcription factor [Flavisolibacter sp.]
MENVQIRVVIVDDHQMVRETWKMLLDRDNRINVIGECASGEEAIVAAGQLKPDVMLMDINMYPMNGLEATREIILMYPQIKIIGVSINNQPTYARNMMQVGASGYVTKNSPREEMLQAIITVNSGETFICREIAEKMNS